jgi:hypothetical protein
LIVFIYRGLIIVKVNWGCCKRITQQRLAVLEDFQGSLKTEENIRKHMAFMEMILTLNPLTWKIW